MCRWVSEFVVIKADSSSLVQTDPILSTHSSIHASLGGFQFSAAVNRPAVNIIVHGHEVLGRHVFSVSR